MKTQLLILCLSVIVWASSFGQSQITLKNGDKMEGEIKSLVNGVMTVKFNGNNLTINQTDIESILMDKKSVSVTTSVNTKTILKGVVTYYFNENYGDKPDIGAIVYLRQTDTTNQKRSFLYNYGIAKACKKIYDYNSRDEISLKRLKKLNADTKEGFHKLDEEAANDKIDLEISKFRPQSGVLQTTVDGNGNYSFSVEPGLYEIIFVSKGRTGSNMTEILGMVNTEIITLHRDETIVLDHRFGIY